MATQKDGKDDSTVGSQHNDWGHSQAGGPGSGQTGNAASTGGVGHRHRDWGHSDVGNAQSAGGEEAGELDSGLGGVGSLSTGNAGKKDGQ
jgi:hypothetical protein